ncbi:MAG: prepilin-type N-terminal cleavage/methylation domain-containing protein [Bdellovibrionia bacterium]
MPTSPPTIFNPEPEFVRLIKNSKGMTLIEIMIVLVIITTVVVFGAPKLAGTGTQLRNTMRSMTVVTKRLHHMARVNHKTYRLVIQLSGDEPGTQDMFWIESSEKPVALLSEEQQEDEDAKVSDSADEKPAGQFAADTSLLKKPAGLPNKIYFEDVELASRNTVITQGRAYIHFLPQGFAEEAAIHITDRKTIHWTILIHPLTGQGEVVSAYVSLKDLNK